MTPKSGLSVITIMTKLTNAVRLAPTCCILVQAINRVAGCCRCGPLFTPSPLPFPIRPPPLRPGEVGQQTVLATFLSTADVADLVLISIDKTGRRTVSVVPQRAGRYAAPGPGQELDTDLVAIDVGRYQGRDAILGFTQSAAFRLDPFTGKKNQAC